MRRGTARDLKGTSADAGEGRDPVGCVFFYGDENRRWSIEKNRRAAQGLKSSVALSYSYVASFVARGERERQREVDGRETLLKKRSLVTRSY